MTEKRYLKLAAEEEARKAERAAAQMSLGKGVSSSQKAALRLATVAVVALIGAAGLVIASQNIGANGSIGEQVRGAIDSGLGLDAVSLNPDIAAYPRAPRGWTRQAYPTIRDARVARGVLEMTMLQISQGIDDRDALVSELAERVEDGTLVSLTNDEKAVFGSARVVAAARTLRQSGGSISTAVYTNGSEVFAIQVVRSQFYGSADDAAAFSLLETGGARVKLAGRVFSDGTRKPGRAPNPLDGLDDVVLLSQQIGKGVFLFVHGLGSIENAEALIGAMDFDLLSNPPVAGG